MAPLSKADLQAVDRLLAAIREVAPPGHPGAVALAQASEQYRLAFDQYVAELQRSKEDAEERWKGLVAGIMKRTGKNREEALRAAQARSPLGQSSHTRVVGTIRRHWLRCCELNSAAPPDQRVPPEHFTLMWLVEANHLELARLVSGLTYWPVGLDLKKRDQWV